MFIKRGDQQPIVSIVDSEDVVVSENDTKKALEAAKVEAVKKTSDDKVKPEAN